MITFSQIGYLGRLGNQMFQFASTLGIGLRKKLQVKFPLENCLISQDSGPFDSNLGRNMPVKCELLDCFEISTEYFIPTRHIFINKFYHETAFTYNNETELITDSTCLSGYFQTEKYFRDCKEIILSQFIFKKEILNSATHYIKEIRNSSPSIPLISIHVRRGDYVVFKDHHPPCSKKYYDDAVSYFRKKFGDCIFLVFSDDINWCKKEFSDQKFIICDLFNGYMEMCCMSLCDHNIIANSSFSWWGSWLNSNQNKNIIAPSKWFGPLLQKDVSDIYCENWKIF